MTETKQVTEPEMKGWLHKWTNYIKGYQKRWFILSNGVLSYYRSQAEMAHTCRGSIRLQGAMIHTEDTCHFVISNAGTNTFHLRASTEVERQRWVTALELAKTKAVKTSDSEYMSNTEDEDDYDESPAPGGDKAELQSVLKTLSAKLEDLQTCSDLIAKQCAALQRSLAEAEAVAADNPQEVLTKMKAVNERATLFRITSSAMVNACGEYAQLAQTQGRKWQRMLSHEHEQRRRLEDMVEQLARQHSHLEQAAQQQARATPSGLSATSGQLLAHSIHSEEDEEPEFYDAEEDEIQTDYIVQVPIGHRRTPSGVSTNSQASEGRNAGENTQDSESDAENDTTISVITRRNTSTVETLSSLTVSTLSENGSMVSRKPRRTRVPDKPNYPLNLWGVMKNCIGKDLSKIPMPVNFSEPLSMLQRLSEDFEYSELLDKAATCSDACEQLAYVAAFTVSSYATTSIRTAKPFNPLLGETFEFDRTDDKGWKVISEQVSHHPPMVAQHCEGRGWRCWQEFTMSSKFRGKYLQVIPLGEYHLEFDGSGNHYTWRKVTTTVHNIIVGKLWVDQSGEMDITNHVTGDKCHLKFIPYSYFSRETQRKVTGAVMTRDGSVKWVMGGTWDDHIEASRVINTLKTNKGTPVFETEPLSTLWKRRVPPPEAERYYNFTELACQLNEMEEGLAPTDSRKRPDQRLMEEGKWDEANDEKLRLEEKQRAARRQRELEAELAIQEGRPVPAYESNWFRKEKDRYTGNVLHVYNGQYWECKRKQDWAVCPDIF
ncbi:Oxysterol-binding protein 1 [Daphnia magna]|uniref:Oxysterol-binding protein 1 n=1 Tax=Daphnia magna TaxID=35525 RepID=A0A0P5JER8_9CRUS|nr:Oxysterol-binding protein 1 [Daphnia magna]